MSYDTIGTIAILDKGTKTQAQKLIKQNKNIKTVLKKVGIHKGKYRTQKLSHLAGEKTKETTHKESGCLFKLNVEKCYFSPRLSNERLRILKQVKKSESILVMFSGIAPYPCILAKKAKEIYAIEANPIAHKYAQENIQLNKLSNIELYKGDVKKVLPRIKKKFDRIIMPLPKTAYKYLPLAKKKLKRNGIIHLYAILKEPNINKQAKELLKNYKIKKITKCGAYSPYKYRICIDIKL